MHAGPEQLFFLPESWVCQWEVRGPRPLVLLLPQNHSTRLDPWEWDRTCFWHSLYYYSRRQEERMKKKKNLTIGLNDVTSGTPAPG